MIKKISILILLLSFLPNFAQQENEARKRKTDSIIQNQFPRTRTFNLEYDRSFARDFESELLGQDFTKGEISSQQTIDFSANIDLFDYKKWKFSTFGNYKNYQFELNDVENHSSQINYIPHQKREFHYFAISLNSTYYGTLFKKLLIFNGSIIADGSDDGFKRIKGLASAVVVLKRTEFTTISVGLLAILDPSTPIPVVPIFSYNQKFKNSAWEFDLILPQRIAFRRPVGQKSRLTIGAFFDGDNGFYVDVNEPNLVGIFFYNQLKIDGGIIYEYKLSKNLIATFQGGIRQFANNRLVENGEQNNDYVYKNEQDITGYFNVGVSFNPFD